MGRNLLQRLMRVILVIVFLAGCGCSVPVATLVPEAPAATSTPVLSKATPRATSLHKELRIKKHPDNYTCFKLETPTGVTIITDPFFMDEDVQPDIVTVSHNHSDHTDFSHLNGKYKLIDTVGRFNEKGIEITGVAGHHNKGDDGTTNIIYVFNISGIRLAQFASQGEMPTEDMFAQIGTVDILIIQIYGGTYGKLSAHEAHDIIRRLQAKIIIPAHTNVSQTNTLTALIGEECEIIRSGNLAVTKDDLAKQQTIRVVVLDH